MLINFSLSESSRLGPALTIYIMAFLLGLFNPIEVVVRNIVKAVTVTCEPQHDKTNKVAVRPANTQINPGIRQSDQSLLST